MSRRFFSRDKGQKSDSNVSKEEDVHVISQRTGEPRLGNVRSPVHRSLFHPATLSAAAPSVVAAIYQDVPHNQDVASGDIKNGIKTIFDQNVTPPVAKYALPEIGGRTTSTSQLAYCLSLLNPSLVSMEGHGEIESEWMRTKRNDPDEQKRLQTMATDLIKAFVRDELKKPAVVAEIVSLAAVLDRDDFRKLLQAFVDGINQSLLLEVHLLNGLAHLIRNAPQGYLDADDLVQILKLLSTRLNETHKQSTQHAYRLSLTISQVLDSMVDSQVEGISREQLHEPLSGYLKELQKSSDSYFVYQAAYAYQALWHIPDDETILKSLSRRTGKAIQGISGVVSAVKAFDLIKFIEGLQSIQESLAGAGDAIELVNDTYRNTKALVESGQGFLDSLKIGLNFARKSAWYPALRGLDRLIQEGRFAEFEKLIRDAPCKLNPAFQWGVCQRLPEIAANTIWDANTGKSAIAFLGDIYKDDMTWGQQAKIKQWILLILNQLADPSNAVAYQAKILLQELRKSGSADKRLLYQGCEKGPFGPYPMIIATQSQESPLLYHVQDIPDIETPLRQLRCERLKDQGGDVYISPRAKPNLRATEDFDLTSKVQEFLKSDRKVFLIRGDSGAGKSTFNRALEISLWDKYGTEDRRIPLFIHLPAIKEPEQDLIAKHLGKTDFTETQIRELKAHREFIVICDGYDESQQTKNLYMSNELNQPRGWRAQMVISCRTEYTGVDYKDCFQPTERNNRRNTELFQEAIIAPFNKNQIQDYIEQYMSLRKPSWKSSDYLRALKQIPNLQDLVKNPFLLRLALEVLPELLSAGSDFPSARITRVGLYDKFVTQWIERGKIRLGEMELSDRDERALKSILGFGFNQRGIMYLKELVTAIYDNQDGNPMVNYSEHRDQGTWKEAIFGERDGRHLLREAIPFTRNGDQYQFIHKSLLEYGLALAVYDPSEHNDSAEPTSVMPRRGSSSSALSFEISASTKKTAITIEQPLLDSPLGRINFVREPSILQFLSERARQEPAFKDQLHSVIERSRTDKVARTGAANAITILVRAGVQFNGADLRNIQIPGADLSFGVFDSAQLEGADLRKVNLRNAWLRQANLNGTKMKGVQFGELPFLQEESEVRCCVYSPDGKLFAVGLRSGGISLYDTSSWKRIHSLTGHTECVADLAFSATSDQIVSGSHDQTIILWDVKTGSCVHTLMGHSHFVKSVAFSPEGGQIASASDDGMVLLWDTDTGDCVHALQGHDSPVSSIAYSPKGSWITSGSHDNTLRLWDADTGECIHILTGHREIITCVLYSPNGGQVASGSADSTVRLWDVVTGDCIHTLQGHSKSVNSISYSPKGDQIVSGSDDWTLRLWDVGAGNCIHSLYDHDGGVGKIIGVMFSPKGDKIASQGINLINAVRLWDVATGDCIHTLEGTTYDNMSIVFSPEGDQLAFGGNDAMVRLWDIDLGDGIHVLRGHCTAVTSVVYSQQGDRIASGSGDNTVRLWDVDTGDCIQTLRGHTGYVLRVAHSPKRNQIASGGNDKIVRLWDVDTGNCIYALQGHTNSIMVVMYSPTGNQIASASVDGTVRLWDVDTGNCIQTSQDHDGILSAMYSPEGGQIAFGGYDKTVRLWDVVTGRYIYTFQGHTGCIDVVNYSPKGDQIASASRDGTVRLWDVKTGDCVHTLLVCTSHVRSIMYSPKGDQIASGDNNNAVRLWDVDTGDCIKIFQGHSKPVWTVVYSPSGDLIASGSQDNTVRLWDVATGHCLVIISGFSKDVTSIAWENTFTSQYFVTGSDDKSVRRWRIINERGKYKALLCWSSSHEALTVSEATFDDVQGLSRSNQNLLSQRGTLMRPFPPPPE